MGWVTVTVYEFEHTDDKCPSHCVANTSGTCWGYDGSSPYKCPGHRNVNRRREVQFEDYDVGSVIDHPQINKIRSNLNQEIKERLAHGMYIGRVDRPSGEQVASMDPVEHSQENVLNDCIGQLNAVINGYQDYGISRKNANIISAKVETGDLAEAENLKKLERNVVEQVRDCICYSDCTAHGMYPHTYTYWVPDGDGGGDGY